MWVPASPPQFLAARTRRHASIRSPILHKKVVLFPLPRPFAGARLTMPVYSRVRQSRQNARGARTAVRFELVSQVYLKLRQILFESQTLVTSWCSLHNVFLNNDSRTHFVWNERSDLFARDRMPRCAPEVPPRAFCRRNAIVTVNPCVVTVARKSLSGLRQWTWVISMPHICQLWMFGAFWRAGYHECAGRSAANLIKVSIQHGE